MFINHRMQISPSAHFVISCSTTPPPGLEGGPAVLSRKKNKRLPKLGGFPEALEEEASPSHRALGDIRVDILCHLGPEG